MEVFGNNRKMRGCFNKFTIIAGGSGAVLNFGGSDSAKSNRPSLRGGPFGSPRDNSTLQGGPFSGGSGPSGFVVTGIAATQAERLYNHKCFNDVNHVYAFGHDPDRSNVTVSAVGMLVSSSGKPSGVITTQIRAYGAARAYAKGSVVSVAMGKDVLTGFLVTMSTSTRSEEYQLQDFQFVLSIPKAYGSGSGSDKDSGKPRLRGGPFGSPREGTTLGGGPFSGGRR